MGVLLLIFLNATGSWAADDPPAERCQGYGDVESIALANWETGLGTWTAGTHDVANPGTFDTPDWASVGDLPGNRAGKSAFVANLDIGDCGADDQSGALTLDSPSIAIPGDAEVPRISFNHWFETEPEYDGGNLKISVNGGAFDIVPDSAFEYGAHNGTLAPAVDDVGLEDNTNPLAGQEAYTGTVDGSPSGSWADVRINLLGIAGPGDTVRLRFDFGIDGCGGAEGWYVDEVEVYGCAAEHPPSDCGNGVLDPGEQCDDGNDFIDDGCSSTCQVEDGWECTDPGAPGSISDPGFEAGTPNPDWTEVSNNPIGTPICEVPVCGRAGGTGPSEGMFWANFGSISTYQEASLSQSVVIPSSVSSLTFDLEIPSCDSAADYVEVLIDDQRQLLIDGSNARCDTVGYRTQVVDVSEYADGESHDLEFYSETFSNNGGVSSFFIDALALPGSPSACSPVGTSLTLLNVVTNDSGGTAEASDWLLTATGPSSFSGSGPKIFSGSDLQPGSYDLSASGPDGYVASDWSCEGGTQQDGDTVVLQSGDSPRCTIEFDDIDTGFEINSGHGGAWYDPETAGQGVLIDIRPADQFLFLAWFTYTDADSADPNQQRWLTAQGNYAGDTASLVLYETLGGRFDAQQEVSVNAVGEATLRFLDCEQAELDFVIDGEGLQGTIPLQHLVPGSQNLCEQLGGAATQAVDINDGMEGGWYEEETSGQGFLVDTYLNSEDGNFMFVAWFTYGEDTASGLRWLTAQGVFEGSSADLTISETTGGSFNDPQPPSTEPVGTLLIDFSDCSHAVATYALPEEGAEGDIDLVRLLPGSEALCEDLSTPQ